MARYMGKGYEEIWKSVMGSEKMPGQSGQATSREESKTKSSGGKYSGMSSEEIWDSVMAKSETPGWKAYQGWLGDYSNVATKYRDYSKRNTGKWQADAFGGTKDAMDSLLGRYDEIYSGLEDDYDKWMFRKDYNGLKKTYDYLQEANKFYSQFRDGDDYDRQRSGYENFGVGYSPDSWGLSDSKALEIRKNQAQKDAKASQKARAEYESAQKAYVAARQQYKLLNGGDGGAITDEELRQIYDDYVAAQGRMENARDNYLNIQNRLDSYNATWGKIDRYAGDTEAARGTDTTYHGVGYDELTDWENKRQEEQLGEEARATRTDYVPGTLTYTADKEPKVEDELGLWRSMSQEQRQDASSSSNGQLARLAIQGGGSYWDLLTDDEVSTYYYIRNQRGQEAANRYLDDMYIELSRRNDAGIVRDIENADTLEKAGMTALSVGANLIGAIPAAMGKTADWLADRKNPYSSSQFFQRYASYVRGSVGQDLGEKTTEALADKLGQNFAEKAGSVANQTFQALMSGVDSAAGGLLFGQGVAIPAGPFDFHVGGYTTVMGLGAFAQRAQELEQQGATRAQIALGSIGSGILEALFEDVSMEAFFTNILEAPAESAGEFVKKLVTQMGVEASEEVCTEIGNMVWDAIVLGKNADNSRAIREYMQQGMSRQEAKAQAAKDAAADIFWAGYGGAVSAGAMAGVGQMAAGAARSAQETAGNFEVGRNIVLNGQVRDLEGQAQQLQDARKSEKLMKLARKAAGLYDQGEQGIGTAYKAGKVATGIAREAGREAARAKGTEFRAAAEAYLAGREDITDKKRALNVLSRVYNKDTQLPGDQAAYRKLGGDKTVKAILDSVGGTESFQARVDQRRAASMRTAAGVQNSVLGVRSNDTGNIEYQSGGDGTALRKGTAEPVQITGIADTKGGLMLKTGDGDTVLAKDIVAGSRGEAAVLNAIDFMETNPYTAQALWDASRVSPLDGVDFAKGIKDAYLQGRVGTPYESIQPYSYAAKLTDAQRKTAWTEGRTALEQYTKAQAEKVNSGAMKAAQKGVTVTDSAQKVKSLNKQQKSAMAAANALAAVGLHIEVYASTPEDRAKGMPNGTYRKSDGGIAVDLNAGDGGQGAMAYALSHETTHFIKDFSAEKYKAYADLLIAEAQRQGIRYDSVFAREYDRVAHMEEYKGLDEKKLHDIAYDETIAEMSEMMLTDTDAIGRIAGKLKNQDKGLWEKIKDFFTGLVEKLRSAYQDAEPDSEIAKILKRAIKDNEALAEAWASAVVDAGENYQLQDGQKKNAQEGERFSLRDKKVPSWQELAQKGSISVVDISKANTIGSFSQRRKSIIADSKEVIQKPYLNKDTNTLIFLTDKSYSHAFSNSGEVQLNAAEHLPQLIENAILTHAEPANHGSDYADGVYTFFAAVKYGDTIQPIKLKVKEYLNKGQNLPRNIAAYLHSDYSDYAGLYDSVVLAVEEIEEDLSGSALPLAKEASIQRPDKSSTVKIADLLELVKGNAEKYIPKQDDIRYSQRLREGDQVERLAKQNEVLEKEVEYLKELVKIQKRGNRDNILDRNSVNKQGKVLMDSVNAKGSSTEFNRMLNDLYREISTVEMDYDTLKEKAGVLADWLLDHHQAEKDSYAQEILDFLAKRRVSLNEGQTGDIEYSYGSLNDFKKAIKGSVIIDPNANTSLDQLWQEAAARFPDRFQADTVDADMPDGLAEIVEWANSSESEGEAQWQYYRAENRNDLIEQVLRGYWEAEPIQSVADKSRAEIAKLRQEHREAMQEARKEKRQAVTDERARSNAAIEAYRAQRDAVDKAQKGLYEADRRIIEQQYAKQMKELRGQYSEDTKTMQTEFFRLLREYEKQQTRSEKQGSWDTQTIQDLRDKLKQEANSHREDSTAWNREFSRLLREYETSGRKIDRLEAKVTGQREAAKAKVESRRRTEERAKIQNTLDTLNRYLLHPTDTVHVPQELQSSVATALDIINQKFLDDKSLENARRIRQYAEEIEALQRKPAEAKAQEIENLQKRIDKLLLDNNNGKNDSKISELNKKLVEVRNRQEEVDTEKIADLNRKIKNLTGRDTSMKAALTSLQEQYRKLEGQGGNMFDSNIADLIENAMQDIGNTAYQDLNLEQLKAVKNAYRALLTTIQNANKTFVAERNAGILDLVNRTRRELAGKPLKNTRQSGIGETYDKFSWNNEKPIYAFERIGSATLSELYRNLRAGEDTWARDVSEAKAFFTGSAARHGYDKWKFGTLETFTASDGTTFQLDLDERMSVYAYSLREQAREHLLQGGITLSANTQREVKGPLGWTRGVKLNDATAYALTTETLQAIADSLTAEQRDFAKEMQQYLSTVMGAKGNEVSMALYGIKKYNERNYWPIKSSGRFSEVVRNSQEQVGNKLKNKGMTKSTVEHANNPIEISGFIDTWGNHVSDMSMYHAFVLPMEDFSKVYNWHQTGDGMGQQSVGIRQLIEQTHGKGAVSYIDTFMKDLNGGIKADPRADVTRKMLSSFKKAAVTASLSVAIQQPSAVGRAFAYIEANYFAGGKVEGVKGVKETWEQMKKYAPGVVVIKDMGRFSMDMGMSVQDYIMGKDSVGTWEKVINKVDDVSGLLPEYADKVTWCAIWEAAKRKTAAMNPGLKGDALLYKAGALFSDTIQKTQVYDSVFSRSANMRSKDLLSAMTTSFMAEPTTTANMVDAAVRKLVTGDKRMGAKMLSAVATATVLNAVLASFVYAMRDKDQDKTYWEKYVASLTAEMIDSFNPLTYVPILNDINSLLLGYSVNRTDLSLASDAIDTIKGLYTTYKRFDPDWDEEHKKEWEKKIRDGWVNTTLSMGNFLGLPLKNIYRDVSGMVNTWTNPSRKAEMSVDTILQAMHSSAKQNFPFISWTADESNSDQLYEAITAGKTVLAKRVKGRFKDQAAYENAIRKGLRDNDPRIHQAAEYVLSMETEKRVRLIRDIVAEGNFDQDTVIKAINAEANSMKEKTPSDKEAKPEKLYSAEEYVNAQSKGLGYSQEIQKGIVQYNLDRIREEDPKLSRERAEDKAKERFQSAVRSETKIAYQDGDLDDSKARKVLLAAEAESEDSVEDKLLAWKTDAELGFEYDWSESQFRQYAKYIKPAGIPADIFDTFVREQKYIKGEDLNGDGNNDPYTTVANKAKYINSLPLTAAQKETLWEGIVDSKKTRARYRLW